MRGVDAHRDRATLLAVLDGEWQSERPITQALVGSWWVAICPDLRGRYGWYQAVLACETGEDYISILVDAEYTMSVAADDIVFTGAKWQRRTVPRDPFAKGGGE